MYTQRHGKRALAYTHTHPHFLLWTDTYVVGKKQFSRSPTERHSKINFSSFFLKPGKINLIKPFRVSKIEKINLPSLHEPLLIFMLLTGLQYQSVLVTLIRFQHVRKSEASFIRISPHNGACFHVENSTRLLLIRYFNHLLCSTFGPTVPL